MNIANRLDTVILCWNDDDSSRELRDQNLNNPDLSKDPELALLLSIYLHGIERKNSQAQGQKEKMPTNGFSISNERLPPPSKFIRRQKTDPSHVSNSLLGSKRS